MLDRLDWASEAGSALLERAEALDALECAHAESAAGHGRLVFLAGEAGIGKTTLLRMFCGEQSRARVFWGACERLFTPRPLGPFMDIAETTGGEFGELSSRGALPHDFLTALVADMLRVAPATLIVEDVHWADEGTLDVLKLLARRLADLPLLAVVSFRNDQLRPADPLQIVLGELAGAPGVQRIDLRPLSLEAVETLAEPWGVDPERLYEKTGGNPFFVTEILAAGDVPIPDTIRDAVLARAAQLGPPARRLLEAAAVVPGRIEFWLVEAVAGDCVEHLEACLRSGMLRDEGGLLTFRHELARLAVEEALAANRRVALHRAVLGALAGSPSTAIDPARLSHHAEGAGDVDAVLRYAPDAGERAARLGAHREAAAQFARALRHAANLPAPRRAYLLERRSYECYLTGQIDDAIDARRLTLALHREREDRLREGDAHRWLSRLVWFAGETAEAFTEANRAIEMLEREPPGPELAMAYSNLAQLWMLAGDAERAASDGGRAVTLAERLGETEIVVHALNSVGAAEHAAGSADGLAKLQRSLALALDARLEEHIARAYTNLGYIGVHSRDYELADRNLTAGLLYCDEHDLDSWTQYMSGWDACSQLDQGRWDIASRRAEAVLRRAYVAVPSRIMPLVVLGRLRVRRGDPDPWAPLDEALELARDTGELQRLAPVAAARAEAHWLAGAGSKVAAETDEALALAQAHGDAWALGALQSWRGRAGIAESIAVPEVAEPFALELAGRWPQAAAAWRARGCPYEAALALAECEDEASVQIALAEFQRLGAVPAARATARRLRARGVRSIARGPRASTLQNAALLTSRQVEVLVLLGDGLTNGEIATRLYLSPKTVDHHVSAVLGKLGVKSRKRAAAEAIRLGLIQN